MQISNEINKDDLKQIFDVYLQQLDKAGDFEKDKVSMDDFRKTIEQGLIRTVIYREGNRINGFLMLAKQKAVQSRYLLVGPFINNQLKEVDSFRLKTEILNAMEEFCGQLVGLVIEARCDHRSRLKESFEKNGFTRISDFYVLELDVSHIKPLRALCRSDLPYKIVVYQKKYKKVLINLINKTIRDECGGMGLNDEYVQEAEKHLNKDGIYLVQHQEKIIGFFMLIFSKKTLPKAELILGLEKEFRNKGIIEILINEVRVRAYRKLHKKINCLRILLRDNFSKRNRLVKRLYTNYFGFKQVAHHCIYEKVIMEVKNDNSPSVI
ncbi:hypothetical protein ACFL5U_03575 [Candidatus Margulisiibacteriota bacterium]